MHTQATRGSGAATAAPLFPSTAAFLVRHVVPTVAVCIALSVILVWPAHCVAQGDEIVPNPQGPAQLRPIWSKGGAEQEYVGLGVGGIGDINDDSLEDFAVRQGALWKIYLGNRGSLSLLPYQELRASPAVHPLTGSFYSGAQRYFGLQRDIRYPNYSVFAMLICPIQGGRIDTVPVTVVTPGSQGISDALAADIDEDGDDELILVQSCVECTSNYWIYEGGENFRGVAPTLIVRDTVFSVSQVFYAATGDLDGDGHVDLISGGSYRSGQIMIIHWGDGTLGGWMNTPRTVLLGAQGFPYVGTRFCVMDADGDSITDIILTGPGDGAMYLYRTNGTGKSARTRSFDLADADAGYHFNGYPHDLGFVRDTTARFAALGLAGTGAFVRGLYLLTGGAKGPNRTYDAWYEDPPGAGLFWLVRPLRDCDGDGWDDFISGNSGYGGFNRGIAVVFAGGPYIPIDDSSASVRQYPLDGTPNGLSLWPNPATTTLNIAWRGDLKRMPVSFVVHDVLGRELASGTMPPGTSSARWECDDVAPGWYSLSVFGKGGAIIGAAGVIVQ